MRVAWSISRVSGIDGKGRFGEPIEGVSGTCDLSPASDSLPAPFWSFLSSCGLFMDAIYFCLTNLIRFKIKF
jgi:hypothetical protein